MSAPLPIARTDLTVQQLRAAATRERDARTARRILAIAMVLDGQPREMAAETQAMDRQTLRDWVIRYNDLSLDGLSDRPRSGRPAKLDAGQRALVEAWVEEGAAPDKDGVVRWRGVDPREKIHVCFGVALHERGVGKMLRTMNFRRVSVRPQHPQSDEAAQEAFKKNFGETLRAALEVRGATGRPVEIWFQDEARVGQQGTVTRVWARRGRARGRSGIAASPGRICSARYARRARPTPRSSCPR